MKQDYQKSLDYIRDFESRIAMLESDKAQEEFVRDFVSDVVRKMPKEILKEVALVIAEGRRKELRSISESN